VGDREKERVEVIDIRWSNREREREREKERDMEGLARERWNVLKKENEQNKNLKDFYKEQIAILRNIQNESNVHAVELVTAIFLNIRLVY
jgi:hypothetical protein